MGDTVLLGPVHVVEKSFDRKLSPVVFIPSKSGHRPRPVARRPWVASTYAPIESTCPNACQFKKRGCYVRAGFTGARARQLDHNARKLSGTAVNVIEAVHIEAMFDGGTIPGNGIGGRRDLRLHVGGDFASARGAQAIAKAALDYIKRGGGTVWSYTTRWRTIGRKAFGRINILASVKHPREGRQALRRGYAPAVVVRAFPNGDKAWVENGVRWIPCVYETRKKTCVECRLCLDRDLVAQKAGIAFRMHGWQSARVELPKRRKLRVVA